MFGLHLKYLNLRLFQHQYFHSAATSGRPSVNMIAHGWPLSKFAPRVHPLWKPQMVKNWKTAIFVLITFLCMMIPNAHSAPGGTKKTRVKIHQWLCQINYTIFLFWKLYSKLDFNALVFAKKNYSNGFFSDCTCFVIILMT